MLLLQFLSRCLRATHVGRVDADPVDSRKYAADLRRAGIQSVWGRSVSIIHRTQCVICPSMLERTEGHHDPGRVHARKIDPAVKELGPAVACSMDRLLKEERAVVQQDAKQVHRADDHLQYVPQARAAGRQADAIHNGGRGQKTKAAVDQHG